MKEQEKQFFEAYSRLPKNQFELNDFITKRRLLGLNYQSIINGLIDDDSLELNKSVDDTIVYGTTIKTITPYDMPKEYVYKRGVISIKEGLLHVNNDFIVPRHYQLITHNPYDLDFVINLSTLKGYNLLIGMFGNVSDDDLLRKIETLSKIKDYLELYGIDSDISENIGNKEYYSYIHTKRL